MKTSKSKLINLLKSVITETDHGCYLFIQAPKSPT